jgi:ABC-type amino acid transport substrate-binding protein
MEASLPPFEWIDAEGSFQGLDVELATALAERWGVEVALVNISYDGLFDALKLGKVDMIISALPYDRTMTRDLAYSHSYFNAGQVLVVQEKDASLRDIAQLPRLRVAVELGSEAHQTVRHLVSDRALALQIVPQREPEAALALLLSGEVDALVCDRVTAFRATTGRGEATPRLRIVGQPLTDEPYVVAVRPDAPALLQQLNDAISEWLFGGKLEELQRHWF